jgi:anti-sigma factor RsiW
MTHVSEEEIKRYIQDKLDDVSRQKVMRHLDECGECFESYLAAAEQAAETDQAYRKGETAAAVSRKISQKGRKLTLSAFQSYAIAASLTLVFLWSGAFEAVTAQIPNVSLAIGSLSGEMFAAMGSFGTYVSALIAR